MKSIEQSPTDVTGLVDHLKVLTTELTALHGDLYWLAMQSQDPSKGESSMAALNVDLLTSLKSAVDDMRLLLWNYIEAASQADTRLLQDELETQRVQRMTQFLEMLRERLGRGTDQQPVSFIERISAAMKQRFSDKVA
jgi:DNA-binding transcriptional regulator YbjK